MFFFSGSRPPSFLRSTADSAARSCESLRLAGVQTVDAITGSFAGYGFSNKPSRNLASSTRRTDAFSASMAICPSFTASIISLPYAMRLGISMSSPALKDWTPACLISLAVPNVSHERLMLR